MHALMVRFSDDPRDYTVGSTIGFGASSIVYIAQYTPRHPTDRESFGCPCALKVVDLDRLPPQSLRLLRRETQLMSLSKHPNVLRVRGSWMDGHKLYIALRLMNSGSAADVMHYGWPGGMEEEVVKSILRQALEGLKWAYPALLSHPDTFLTKWCPCFSSYLHINGFIHRDVKAANLLIDDDGTVLLGDLGVAADLHDEEAAPVSSSKIRASFHAGSHSTARQPAGSHGHPSGKKLGKRKSFVGTVRTVLAERVPKILVPTDDDACSPHGWRQK